MVCLLALLAGFAPRIALVLLWIFTPLVNITFNGWIIPLLGVIFLPYTTLFYMLAYSPTSGLSLIGWLVVLMGLFLDLGHTYSGYLNKDQAPGMSAA
ncbi:MAG: hypothetical protein GY759_19125 [Chloroflexi bacterium]|nr:hypothetical protein [Chloroflexota bacterium]